MASRSPSSFNASYFLAETLKYLWLLFSDDQAQYDLNKVVFNTEVCLRAQFPVRLVPAVKPRDSDISIYHQQAHPLPVFDWNEEEIEGWKIPVR